jgi:hypothetical protein
VLRRLLVFLAATMAIAASAGGTANAVTWRVCFSGNLGLIPDGQTTGFLFGGGATPKFEYASFWSATGSAGYPFHLIIDDRNYKTSHWANIASNSGGNAQKSTAYNYSRDTRVHNNYAGNNSSIGEIVEGKVGVGNGAPCSVGNGG